MHGKLGIAVIGRDNTAERVVWKKPEIPWRGRGRASPSLIGRLYSCPCETVASSYQYSVGITFFSLFMILKEGVRR